MLTYREMPASAPLRNVVRCVWFLSGNVDAVEIAPEKILPDGCMEIIIHLGTPFVRIRGARSEVQARAFLMGQLTESIVLRQSANSHVMGIRFTPQGAASFVPFHVDEIRNTALSLDNVWGKESRLLEDAVLNAASDSGRVAVIESFLSRKLSDRNRDRRIEAAVGRIETSQGRVSIEAIAADIGWSTRQLERRFLSSVGIGPKALARIVRLQTLLQTAGPSAPRQWPSIALACGFFDQAHLIREFKRFAGEPPESFFDAGHRLYEFFTAGVDMSDLSNTRLRASR